MNRIITNRIKPWLTSFTSCLLALAAYSANAGSISAVGVVNNSSPDGAEANGAFSTQSTLSAVSDAGNTSTFDHRMAFFNTYTATGGVAQVHKRNVTYLVDFTVEDPANLGFTVDVSSFLQGVSTIEQTSAGGTATATGASFFVEIDDSTDAANTFSNLLPLFSGTSGASVTGIATQTTADADAASANLGNFTGTTSFTLSHTTFFSPTTNVFFGNSQTGSGSVVYGLGTLPPGTGLALEDLGHFLTVTATFNVPEPTTGTALFLGTCLIVATRRRK